MGAIGGGVVGPAPRHAAVPWNTSSFSPHRCHPPLPAMQAAIKNTFRPIYYLRPLLVKDGGKEGVDAGLATDPIQKSGIRECSSVVPSMPFVVSDK